MSNKLRSIAGRIKGILWEANAETFQFTYVSPQSLDILGYTPEQWYESTTFWEDHIHPEDREEAVDFCHCKTVDREDHEFEYRMIDANGNVVWIRDFVTVEEREGEMILTGLMIDITERHQKSIEKAEIIRKSYELVEVGHWEYDLVNKSLYWSQEVKKLHEVEQRFEPDLESAIQFYPDGINRQTIQQAVNNAIETGEPYDIELQIITAKGNSKWIRTAGDTKWVDGKCVKVFGTTQDITRQKENENEVEKLSRVARETQNIVIITDTEERIQWVNKAFEKITGYRSEEVIGKNPGALLQGKNTNPETIKRIKNNIAGRKRFTERILNYNKNDEPYWVQMNVTPIENNQGELTGYFSIQEEVTEMVRSQNRNEVLLQEIHHRVKNNLAIISGILTLEMEEFSNDRAKLSFQRSINRIQSIAKVHELLYGNNDLSSLNISEYLDELSTITQAAFGFGQDIDIELKAEGIEMNINTAIPFGMLMNELLTNSYKYAFEDGEGNIFITIEREHSCFNVTYRDNGRGMREQPNIANAETLGFTIINTLLIQLDATYSLNVDNQFELIFTFEEFTVSSHSLLPEEN